MFSCVSKSVKRIFVLACMASLPLALGAQDSAKPAAKTLANDYASKWDIFAGFSYLSPNVASDGLSNFDGTGIRYGAIGSVSRYFNRYAGVQFEGDYHNDNNEQRSTSSDFEGGSGGLILRYPTANFTPFVHALVGGESAGSYYYQNQWGMVITAGGGLDYNTPLFNHRMALRLVQADYQFNHQDFNDFNMLRLSAGVVFRIGSIAPPVPVTLTCAASPAVVLPGDPVTVTATASSLDPKLNVIYSFSGDAVTANGATAAVATGTLAPGTYTVKCGVKEGKAGKEGLKPWQTADAAASYTVKAFEPPTISCSASPSTIKPGETSTVTASGVSPQNRPLTYNYSASAGTISGTGATASFSSTGAPTGATSVTCNVTDDKGQMATATTNITITAPYVPPASHTQALCSISFSKDTARPTRVDNEAKACLDEIALDLQKQSDANAVVVGEANAKEQARLAKEQKEAQKHKHLKVVDPAAERAVNTKDYLVKEKGIDAARISVATGTTDDQKAENYLVPSGATFATDVAGTTVVDETTVKAQPRKALGAKKHHAKAAAEAK